MQYTADFAFGALLSWKRDQIVWLYNRTPLALKIAILGLTTVGYYAASKPIFLPLSACAVIVFAQQSFIKRFLQRPFAEYLGRISYSLYLVHGTILFTTLIMLYGRIPFIEIFTIYIVLSFIAAHLFCVLIEEPSLRLGKRLTQQTPRDSP